MNLSWFNVSAPRWQVGRVLSIRLWNLFNRRSVDGHFWGFGLLQINSRHLLYIGHSGASALFLGAPGSHATWREQAIRVVASIYLWLQPSPAPAYKETVCQQT